jgi:ERCC4-type nuclease
MKIPSKLTVLVDSRERYPLLFPGAIKYYRVRGGDPNLIRVATKVEALKTGDYCLKGYDGCMIERKGSMRELQGNLFTKDYRRSKAAFTRLVEACDHPYILLDFPLSEMFQPTENVLEPERVLDALLDTIQEFGLGVLWPGPCKTVQSRTRLGELCVRLMLCHALQLAEPMDVKEMLDILLEKKDDTCGK